jgi:hypothetical protein
MESGGSFPERTWDFSLFACTGGSLGRGDPALPLAKRTGARVACPQSSVLPVQPASSVCKKLINTRCGSRTVAGPGASVLRSGQAMPHFVILRQLHNRVILVRWNESGVMFNPKRWRDPRNARLRAPESAHQQRGESPRRTETLAVRS